VPAQRPNEPWQKLRLQILQVGSGRVVKQALKQLRSTQAL
jgi:hypothetical protein